MRPSERDAGAGAPRARRAVAAALALALAICVACLSFLQAASASPAYVDRDGDGFADTWVHDSNGMTWEEVRDNRGETSSDDWSSEWIGGEKVPTVDIFDLGGTLFPSLIHFVYTGIESACSVCVDVCNALFETIADASGLTAELDDSQYAEVYSRANDISETIIQPVAVGFLGLALVLELLQFSREVATNKGDHFGMLGSYLWIVVKFSAIMVLIGHTTLITRGLYELFLWLARNISGLLTVHGLDAGSFDSFMLNLQEVTYADFGHIFLLLIVAVVLVVVASITVMRVVVLTVVRMFEIYVYMAFAGFPLVMVSSRQTREGGLRYFKSFAAACLQAAVLIVLVSFAGVLMSSVSALLETTADAGIVSVIINVLAPIAGCFGVNAVVGKSREIANQILGA